MILVEKRADGEQRQDGKSAERILVIGEGAADAVKQSEPGGRDNGNDPDRQQSNDERLLLHRQQRDQICRSRSQAR